MGRKWWILCYKWWILYWKWWLQVPRRRAPLARSEGRGWDRVVNGTNDDFHNINDLHAKHDGFHAKNDAFDHERPIRWTSTRPEGRVRWLVYRNLRFFRRKSRFFNRTNEDSSPEKRCDDATQIMQQLKEHRSSVRAQLSMLRQLVAISIKTRWSFVLNLMNYFI